MRYAASSDTDTECSVSPQPGISDFDSFVTEQEYVPRRPLQAATRQRFIVFYVYKTRETCARRRLFQSDINTDSTHSTQNDRAPTGSMHTLNSRYVTRQRPFRDNLVRLQGTSFHSERPTFNRRLPRAHPTGRRETIILPRSITTTYGERSTILGQYISTKDGTLCNHSFINLKNLQGTSTRDLQ